MFNLIPALILIILQGALGVEPASSPGLIDGIASGSVRGVPMRTCRSALVREALRQICADTSQAGRVPSSRNLLLRVALLELLVDGCAVEPAAEHPESAELRTPIPPPLASPLCGGHAEGRRSRDGPRA